MIININKNSVLQYLAIYLMIIINQTNLYMFVINENIKLQYFILGLFACILLGRYIYEAAYGLIFSILLLIFVIFVRYTSGGVGISFWLEIALKVMVVFVAILIEPKKFLYRFIVLVSTLSVISLIFYILNMIGINVAQMIFPVHNTQNVSVTYDLITGDSTKANYQCYGIYIYSYLTYYPTKNVSIFTEPGIFQMVINSALFALLFFEEQIFFNKGTKKFILVLLTITLISTKSTSGYIGYIAIICSTLLRKHYEYGTTVISWKKNILIVALLSIFTLGIDYAMHGETSFLSEAFIDKLYDSSNRFSLTLENSTGKYRVASIYMAIQSMLTYPLGTGYDRWRDFMTLDRLAGAGGFPFTLGAVLGIVPFFVLLIWLLIPFKYIKHDIFKIVLFVFLYFNSSLAQTSAVYPALIMFPVLVWILKNRHLKHIKQEVGY